MPYLIRNLQVLWLLINTQDLDGLEWVYSGDEILGTAKSESKFQIYLGQVILDGKQYQIPGRQRN